MERLLRLTEEEALREDQGCHSKENGEDRNGLHLSLGRLPFSSNVSHLYAAIMSCRTRSPIYEINFDCHFPSDVAPLTVCSPL